MRRLILFIPIFLFAVTLDFSSCYKKFSFIKNDIPISLNKSITFTKPKTYLFYDPFTGMFVINKKNKKIIKFSSYPKLGWWMAGIKNNSVFGGTYAKKAFLLNMARLSVDVEKNSVISDLFCRAYGVGNRYFIPKEYLMHFAKYGYWGDVGIEINDKLVVKSVDPYYVKNIQPGERIISINSKPANLKNFTKYVILNQVGRVVKIKTNKHEEILKIRKKIYNFTPLNNFGIVVNKNLEVVKLPESLKNRFFPNKPIKVYEINGEKISSFDELLKKLSSRDVTITFIQDGIKIKVPLR